MINKNEQDIFNTLSIEAFAIGIEKNIYNIMTTKKPDSIMLQSLGVSMIIYTIIKQEENGYEDIEE